MNRNNFYRAIFCFYLCLLALYFLVTYMVSPAEMMTIHGLMSKNDAVLLIVMINLLLLLLPLIAEYRYRKALEQGDKVISVYMSRVLWFVKIRTEDYLPFMYMLTILCSLVSVIMYNYWFLGTIYNWDITAAKKPGAPFQLHMLVVIVPIILVAIALLAIILRYGRKAEKAVLASES